MGEKKVLWPGWETVRLIGHGSFGAVYEIERDVLGDKEKAALKVITIPQSDSDITEMLSDGYDDESITSTFKEHLKSIVSEYSLMRKLNGSANVVSCDDVRYVQHDDGIGWDIFIKMELLTPLISALPEHISDELTIKIAKDICHALVQCKQFDIIHRDIKPQNIFVSPLGDYKLGDFGIAKTVEKTSGGTKIGTYKYMAPEVYNNQPYGVGADIYSLGLVLYWLLNERRLPFLPLPPEKLRAGLEEQARLRRFNGEPIPAPAHGSEELKQIVLKACAYDPKDRYQSAEEMLRALELMDGVTPEFTIVPPKMEADEYEEPATVAGTSTDYTDEETVYHYRRSDLGADYTEAKTTGRFDNHSKQGNRDTDYDTAETVGPFNTRSKYSRPDTDYGKEDSVYHYRYASTGTNYKKAEPSSSSSYRREEEPPSAHTSTYTTSERTTSTYNKDNTGNRAGKWIGRVVIAVLAFSLLSSLANGIIKSAASKNSDSSQSSSAQAAVTVTPTPEATVVVYTPAPEEPSANTTQLADPVREIIDSQFSFLGDYPSAADLDYLEEVTGTAINRPSSRQMLDSYELRYVRSRYGNCIYYFWYPQATHDYIMKNTVDEGTPLIVLGQRDYMLCVTFWIGDRLKYGWVSADLTSDIAPH